ncbi:MAG TPA: hypothetical protein VMN57_02450 [Anaerolineales bacterium]|nr:hypothetical protein [Anaerolineales bacterium]
MNRETLRSFLQSEERQPFEGWDFSYLSGRIAGSPLDWSYPSILFQLLRGGDPPKSLLDMGTGGGEFFSTLHPFPPFTCVTEAYPPNALIARRRLEPLGVLVFEIEEDDPALPFADGQFELVANRHEYYDPAEVFRITAPDGQFVTQQVGGLNDIELIEKLGGERPEEDRGLNLARDVEEIRSAGFTVLRAQECVTKTRIFDAGAVVYYFKALPWEIPGFSVDTHFEALARIHDEIEANGFIETGLHRLLIVASKRDG